jgi:hypothetical protein
MKTAHTLESLSRIENPEEFSFAFRNFLDAFYAAPSVEYFVGKPAGTDRARNAYLAGAGEFLCNRHHLRRSEWMLDLADAALIADPPYFASAHPRTKAWLLAESPQEFRQRNVFVGADALSRA